MVNGFGSDII